MTSIFARGIYNNPDFMSYLSPNCVVSLASPKVLPSPLYPDHQLQDVQVNEVISDASNSFENSTQSSQISEFSEPNENGDVHCEGDEDVNYNENQDEQNL